MKKLLIPCFLACVLGACAIDSFSLTYRDERGHEIGGTIHLDPSFARDKK